MGGRLFLSRETDRERDACVGIHIVWENCQELQQTGHARWDGAKRVYQVLNGCGCPIAHLDSKGGQSQADLHEDVARAIRILLEGSHKRISEQRKLLWGQLIEIVDDLYVYVYICE